MTAPAARNALVGVAAPAAPVYRLTKLGRDPFEPAPYEHCGHNRFDDPLGEFRVVYCASTRIGAFGECLARFRRSLRVIALMAEVVDDEESLDDALDGLVDPSDSERGVVPLDWRLVRQVGVSTIRTSLQFADIMHPENVSYLRRALAPLAVREKYPDVDLSTVLGPNRVMTQHCARHIYEQVDESGQPRFAGIPTSRDITRTGSAGHYSTVDSPASPAITRHGSTPKTLICSKQPA